MSGLDEQSHHSDIGRWIAPVAGQNPGSLQVLSGAVIYAFPENPRTGVIRIDFPDTQQGLAYHSFPVRPTESLSHQSLSIVRAGIVGSDLRGTAKHSPRFEAPDHGPFQMNTGQKHQSVVIVSIATEITFQNVSGTLQVPRREQRFGPVEGVRSTLLCYRNCDREEEV